MKLSFYKFSLTLTKPLFKKYFRKKAKSDPNYAKDFDSAMSQRFEGKYDSNLKESIHFHAASVGEVSQIKSLIELLKKQFSLPIVISCQTPTGLEQAKKLTDHAVYAPLEYSKAIESFIKSFNPVISIFVETEIWPLFNNLLHSNLIPIMLINGQISEKSFSKYSKSILVKNTIMLFKLILTQDQTNLDNFRKLGASNIQISGNIKFSKLLSTEQLAKYKHLRQTLQSFQNSKYNIVFGSAYEEELELALNFLKYKPNAKLIIAPRRLENIDQFQQKIHNDIKTIRLSQIINNPNMNKEEINSISILLVDTFGDLPWIYGFGKINLIGGTFTDIGGHDPLEAILWKNIIVVGPITFNIDSTLNKVGTEGYFKLGLSSELEDNTNKLIEIYNNIDAIKTGDIAHDIIENNKYSLIITYQAIKNIIETE